MKYRKVEVYECGGCKYDTKEEMLVSEKEERLKELFNGMTQYDIIELLADASQDTIEILMNIITLTINEGEEEDEIL